MRKSGIDQLIRALSFILLLCIFFIPSSLFASGDKPIQNARELLKQKRYSELSMLAEKVCGAGDPACGEIVDVMAEIPGSDLGKLEKACRAGKGWACLYIGISSVFQKEYPAQCLDRGCHYGDPFCCFLLGTYYAFGHLAKRPKKAFSLIRKACDQNVAVACGWMGSFYSKGYGDAGVKKDKRLAAKYYKKACDLGCKQACGHTAPFWEKASGQVGEPIIP